MTQVSVIIPSYNDADTVGRAIDSAVNQTITDIEILLIDDASCDDTERVVNSYNDDRIQYIKHAENHGGGAARNTGIRLATGEYIAFLDADDEWKPEKLEYQLEHLASKSEAWVGVYCDVCRQKGEWKQIIEAAITKVSKPSSNKFEGGDELVPLILSNEIDIGGSSTLFIKSSAVKRVEGFDEKFPRHQDFEFLIRLLQVGKLSFIDEELVKKFPSGTPAVEVVEEAKKRYFSKFSEEITKYEQEGYPITEVHNFELTRYHFQSGNFKQGFRYLSKSEVNTVVDTLRILASFARGLRGT